MEVYCPCCGLKSEADILEISPGDEPFDCPICKTHWVIVIRFVEVDGE